MGQAAGVAAEGIPGRTSGYLTPEQAAVIGASSSAAEPAEAPAGQAIAPLLVIFGASGGTGLAIIQTVLEQGTYRVRAFVRSREKLRRELEALVEHERLEIVESNLENLEAVKAAMKGAHAVISVAGASPETAKGPMAAAVPAIVEGCRAHGVHKLIVQSGALSAAPGEWLGLLTHARLTRNIVRWQIGSNVVDDNEAVMQYLYSEARDLDWVISRPAFLEEGERIGPLSPSVDPFRPGTVRYLDVADWILQQVESNQYVGKMPRLYYPPVSDPI